ncbi:protein CSF1 [Podospora aff. communis PSN243]|uniref:Protein CSF1 n=1 Tax=Podospora aff. communis PSN243 TaxID=3040156 RepID=A0AAV9H3B8_9PEZI|nr:protein CSF1 [Podospora aff. communis PSN243]
MSTSNAGTPLDNGPEFNSLFLGSLIGCGVLSVVFLLYFNRVFASVVSWGIRTWTWHQYRVYIDIQALQISLLAGRVFFTGLRYHGNNETIFVQNGYITWAYWLRRVREVNIEKGRAARENADAATEEATAKLPCRINVSLLGLEWFIYNRTPAYDSILAGLTEPEAAADAADDEKNAGTPQGLRRRHSRGLEPSENDGAGLSSSQFGKAGVGLDEGDAAPDGRNRRRSSTIRSSSSDDSNPEAGSPGDLDGLPLLLQLYPVHLYCDTAAVVAGNENTKSVLIVKAKSFSGEIDASETETPDPYRQFYRLKFEHPVVEMRENQDFREEQADRATRDKHASSGAAPPQPRSFLHQQKRRALGKLRDLVPYWQRSVESISVSSSRGIGTAASQIPGSSHWQGLSRYLYDDADDSKARWASSEYAAVPTILDSPEATLTIFWDMVAKVCENPGSSEDKASDVASNINGDEPPAWAINLSIKGGSVNYGPWADRQRAELQRMFAPSLCKDAVPAARLPVGAWRVPTQFKLYVELEEVLNVRIPIREESKNWRWKGKEPGLKEGGARGGRKSRGKSKKTGKPATAHQRPYGWLDIKVAANATISYSMDMLANASGYTNTLKLDLPTTEISSSLNHELLWRSGRQRISCDLSNPLKWNTLRQWHFNVHSEDLELFLLRDHVFLLIDLMDDWASGPPTDYLVFTPFKYHLNLQLHNVRLYLNVNDANIVDNPTDMEDNSYIIIASPLLQATTCIPIDKYRPSRNTIPFDIRAETASVDLHVPPWNTQAAFLASKEIAHLENLAVDGSYNYNATTSPANTDTLILNVSGQSPTAHVYGFIVRYFLKIKDNYFGDDIHFKTLEEYQDILRLKETSPEGEAANKQPHKKSNDLDVILSIRADDPKILLPANLYSSQRHVQIDTASLSLDLRFTNYYMDMDLVVAPLNMSLGNLEAGAETPITSTSSTQLFVDGLNIYGHRLFGLPPTEPTYLCNWDITAGAVSGECSAEFLTTLMSGGKAFAFSFDDDENALISLSSIVMYDVTFLRAAVQSVRLWLRIDEAAFLVSTGTIEANYNDWARSHYSRRADIKVPEIKLSCVNAESAARYKGRSQHPVETDALVETSLRVAIIGRKVNFTNERKLQQELVRREDQRTHRTPFLLLPDILDDDFVPDVLDPPAQTVPPIPLPIMKEDIEEDQSSLNSRGTSRRSRGLRHKSSFLSLSSSDTSSILKPFSSKRSSGKSRLGERLHPLSSLEQGGNRAHARELSVSTRHSAFYSAAGDYSDRQDVSHNTVAFSSPYFAPYFPLENTRPSHRDAMAHSIEEDAMEADDENISHFELSDVDPHLLDEECAYSSIILEAPSGLTAFCNPTSMRQVVALLSALQPTDPENILDSIQVDAMKEIFGSQKEQKMKGQIQDILVGIPRVNVRFVNADSTTFEPPAGEQDQFDMSLERLVLASRSETKWSESIKPEWKESRSSLHLRLNAVELSAVERNNGLDDPQAVALAQVQNVMASMGSKGMSYLDVEVGNIQGNASSQKIEYFASLVHRTSVLGSELGALFAEASRQETLRVQSLVQRLVEDGQGAPDPSVLVRPSAVLRSASQHLRTYDSWKLAMRLRQIWAVQPPTEKEQSRLSCLDVSQNIEPGPVREKVVAAFHKWRSWDLENLEDSALLNLVFGPSSTRFKSPASKPTLAVVRLKRFQLALDPGPKQNEISFLDVTGRLESKVGGLDKHAPEGGGEPTPEIVMTLNCAEAAVNLNWELCEMAGDVIRMIKRMGSPPTPKPEPAAISPVLRKSRERTVHCVLSLGHGSVTLEAINIHATTSGHGIKASLLARQGAGNLVASNLILSCDTINSSLRSHSQSLAKFVMESPSIFFSHELQTTDTTDSHTIKTTASSRYLSLVVKQDPINLAEVLDLVVQDEVAQLYRLKNQLPASPRAHSPGKRKIVERLSAFRVNVAMFMDEYTVSVPLLRTLTYTVNGTVSRAAMAANFGREIIFDFDIKENSHEMQIKVDNVARSISLLQIPPTNGRIRSHMDRGEHSVSVFASLELVQLDASAVYSLLTALNRPEISNVINELQQQVKLIEEHLGDIDGDIDGEQRPVVASRARAKDSTVLAYTVNLTFAGFEVFGNSPLKSDEAPLAHVLFALDSIHLRIANRLEQHGPVLVYPELHANLRHIAFEISKGTAEAMHSCGNLAFGALVTASSRPGDDGKDRRFFDVKSDAFEVNLSPVTVSTVVDVLGYMGDKIKDLDTSRELEYLRKLRQSKPRIAINDAEQEEEADIIDQFFSSITYTFEICDIQLAWLVNRRDEEPSPGKEDLVLSLQRIEFGTRTRNSARLTIENLQLQMVPPLHDKGLRSANSALLPEVIFQIAYVSTSEARRLAFQAVGKSVDIRLTSGFIIPAANLSDSLTLSLKNAQQASQNWIPVSPVAAADSATTTQEKIPEVRQGSILGTRRLESLLIDADFAGAVVYLTGKKAADDAPSFYPPGVPSKRGQFGQEESVSSTALRSPGLALKVEFRDDGKEDPSLYGEVKIDASSNILYPSVVPLIVDISNSIKAVVSSRDDESKPTVQPQDVAPKPKGPEEDNILAADPTAVLGRMKLNLGLRIRKQEFSLSCQPIARVAATASFEDVYFTANTVRSIDQGNFFAISGAFTNLQASVQHVYSRESTGSFKVDSIVVSLMNSKHVSGTNGVFAILKVSPMEVSVNAKQLQDFMLFREIWLPRDITETGAGTVPKLATETSQGRLVQRYQQVAATAAFPWTASISISALKIDVDLGQALGKASFAITEFWVSSKKTSDWEQNLCLGFKMIGVESTGRMSGFVALQDFKLRSSIMWPEREQALNETPMIQASVGFSQFRVKAAFDYQAFLVADITSLEFLMYNVRRSRAGSGDRLVAIFDGEAVQVFGTTTSAAQAVALYQAFQRLVQERKANFESSLKEIEKFMKRKSVSAPAVIQRLSIAKTPPGDDTLLKSPISLDTDVVVTLKALNLGVFPSTFSDHQVFKMEALNAQARFAASVVDARIHSILGLTLGQLRIGLAGVRSAGAPKTVSELSVEDVVQSATGSRGGTILKVPQVEAVMQTWQRPDSKHIDYIFKSAFEGKVEVGWNYSRISYIRGMWGNHAKALAQTWGRELPPVTAIRVTGVPESPGEEKKAKEAGVAGAGEAAKITAEVKVPVSKYEYTALEPPVIETPQLRDMGEATPPLEWIGLNRDRLPNLTHQIVIVSLLELAGEVEDAYSKILGSS